MMKAHESHRHAAPERLGCYVVTVSTSRYNKRTAGEQVSDESGDVAEKMIKAKGHPVLGRDLIPDDAEMLKSALSAALRNRRVDVVLFIGGTGVSTTDITIETIRPFFEKEIEGFGELLRFISYEKIGAAAALTRATAGTLEGKLVLCLPGSPDGVETALKAFLGELPHVIYLARGQK